MTPEQKQEAFIDHLGPSQEYGPALYHRWYYNYHIWRGVSFLGVYCAKNVLDLWNYQEILWELKPGLVVEFGTYAGGSALYFASILEKIWRSEAGHLPQVLTVDNGFDGARAADLVRVDPHITVLTADTVSAETQFAIKERRQFWNSRGYDPPGFFILDSDHHKDHVLAELEMLRDLTRPGDYVVVEDTNINGHPVLPDFGPGPWEALEEYEKRHPEDYRHDTEREQKFGFTFAPRGYLIRK
jgi:cephalosporin hydroxylase